MSNGEKLSQSEQRDVAIRTYDANPEYKQVDIARRLCRAESTVSDWLRHKTEQRRRKQIETIAILQRLGWTQQEVAAAVGLTHQGVSKVVQQIPESEKLYKAQLAQGKSPAQVAEFNDISETYANCEDRNTNRPERPWSESDDNGLHQLKADVRRAV